VSTEGRGRAGGRAGRRIVIPAAALAGEIEFAIAYTVACNPGRDLLHEPDRALLAEAIVDQLAERAARGLSGMRVLPAEVPGEEIASHPAGT
jgi:hypothetical protein